MKLLSFVSATLRPIYCADNCWLDSKYVKISSNKQTTRENTKKRVLSCEFPMKDCETYIWEEYVCSQRNSRDFMFCTSLCCVKWKFASNQKVPKGEGETRHDLSLRHSLNKIEENETFASTFFICLYFISQNMA